MAAGRGALAAAEQKKAELMKSLGLEQELAAAHDAARRAAVIAAEQARGQEAR